MKLLLEKMNNNKLRQLRQMIIIVMIAQLMMLRI